MDCPIPNNDTPGNRMRGSFPLPMEASTIDPPNKGPGGDRREGSFPLAGEAGPVNPPDSRFKDNWGLTAENRPVPMPADKEGARLVNPGLGASPMPAWAMMRPR
jgi:hypothetical protein